ncbi:MAG: enolase C-terminal domain-like protein [Planctomycetota bacterium]|jgi:L-alanine-DL-glutamate epimerase-like enolase superfamily enzyme|nr:enolase C-terminal domain-like protein [Planctomycetota bacterium]MDP7253546.1 enolase C-terminal domain-like protein [Planctomycetota bacterium]
MPAKIKSITLIPVRVPIPYERVNCPEFADQMLTRDANNGWGATTFFGDMPFLVVKVQGDDGSVGWSDSRRYDKTDRVAEDVIDYARNFVGESCRGLDPAKAHLGLEVSRPEVRFQEVQTAALVWSAEARRIPFYSLFGEKVRDEVRVEYWSGFRTPAGAEEFAREGRQRGFCGLKLKAHLDIDVAGVTEAVFRGGGEDFHLNIDPNGRWETVDAAVERARAMLEVSSNVLLEDPIYNKPKVAEIRRQTGIPTAVSVTRPEGVRETLALEAADVFNLGGNWVNQISTAASIEKSGLPYWLSSSVETGLGDMASAHFAAALPGCTIGSDLAGNLVREHNLLTEPIEYRNGHAVVPDSPGLGVAADEEAIENYRIGDPVVVQ